MTENENIEKEKTSSVTRPGYTYAASFDKPQNADQFVRVKLEINGEVKVVPVCALCHKAFRLCSLDPSVTEEQIASCKYLGLAEGTEQDTTTGHQSGAADKKDSAISSAKDSNTASKDSEDKKDSKKSSMDSSGKDKTKEEEEKKKKKKLHDSDQRRKTLPKTEWTTNKPSHDDWDKRKKKDF